MSCLLQEISSIHDQQCFLRYLVTVTRQSSRGNIGKCMSEIVSKRAPTHSLEKGVQLQIVR